MYNIEMLEDKAQEILDMSPLTEQNAEILDSIMKSYLYPPFEMGAEAKP